MMAMMYDCSVLLIGPLVLNASCSGKQTKPSISCDFILHVGAPLCCYVKVH